MKLYGAIDLHSTNNVTVVINEHDQGIANIMPDPEPPLPS
jgi:hypothetical protein